MNLDNPLEADWAVTMLFYSAVHFLEAYRASKGHRSLSHQTRENYMRENPLLQPLVRPYKKSQDLSEEARYQIAEYEGERVRTQIRPHYERIKQHMCQVLGIVNE